MTSWPAVARIASKAVLVTGFCAAAAALYLRHQYENDPQRIQQEFQALFPAVFQAEGIVLRRSQDGVWNWTQPAAAAARLKPLILESVLLHFEDLSEGEPDAFRPAVSAQRLEITPGDAGSPWKFLLDGIWPGAGRVQVEMDYAAAADRAVLALQSAAFHLNADLENLRAEPRWTFNSRGRFALPERPFELMPAGQYTLSLEGQGSGSHPAKAVKTLQAAGALDIRNGIWAGRNLLREVLQKMQALPGFESLGQSDYFPVNSTDLPFDILQAEIRLRSGSLWIEQLTVKHSRYLIQADGTVSLTDRAVELRMKLVLLEPLSSELAEQVPGIRRLENQDGRVVVPFVYRGLYPEPSVFPEFDYLTQMLARAESKSQ